MSTQTNTDELSPENQSQMMDEIKGATLSINPSVSVIVSSDQSSINSSPINMNKKNMQDVDKITEGRGDQLEKRVYKMPEKIHQYRMLD